MNSTSVAQITKAMEFDYKIVPSILQELSSLSLEEYKKCKNTLINSSENPTLTKFILTRKNLRYRHIFWKRLQLIMECDSPRQDKIRNMYQVIQYQSQTVMRNNSDQHLRLPEDIHKWFLNNLPLEQVSFHYQFLINNNILLSNSDSMDIFRSKLLQGSEFDIQTATFECLLDSTDEKTFTSKFMKLNSFSKMLLLTNQVIKRKKQSIIPIYLAALVEKLNYIKKKNLVTNSSINELLFIKFLNELLYFLAETNNVSLFVSVFKITIQYIRDQDISKNPKILNILHRPLLDAVKLFSKNDCQDEIFNLISVIDNLPMNKGHHFLKRFVVQTIKSIRPFNDPKLSLQLAISAVKNPNFPQLLNQLGLVSWIFQSNSVILSSDALKQTITNLEMLVPYSMKVQIQDYSAILTELYLILLQTNFTLNDKEEFRTQVLDLYYKYIAVLVERNSTWNFALHDTGILCIILRNIIFNLNDRSLAYELLINFYSHNFHKNVKYTPSSCPFSHLIYGNTELTSDQLANLFTIMEKNNIPFSFKICAWMVIKLSTSHRIEEAYSWYQKIYYGKFEIRHIPLIKIIKENGWKFPPNFDRNLLDIAATQDRQVPDEEYDDMLFLNQGEGPHTEFKDLLDCISSLREK